MSIFNFTNEEAVFGLDIGYETLKLVQLSKKGKVINLVGCLDFPLTERIMERDSFKNKAATANLIKEACRKAKPYPIKAKKIVSALPETFVFSKTIQMPKMTDREYIEAVPSEAVQYLPIPVEEVYLDYQVLIAHPDESLVDILLVASPRKLVDEYVEVTKLAGLELVGLETKPLAVGRAATVSSPLNGSVIVEIGTEFSRVSIWDNNNIRLTTSVNIGKNQILEGLGVSGIALNSNASSVQLSEDAATIVTNLADEITNSIKYHQNRDFKPSPITKILLCGTGAAKIKDIDRYIEKKLKISTEIIKPRLDSKDKIGTEFITSYGLALRSEFE